MSEYKFRLDELVLVDNVVCVVLSREIFDGMPDYLCKPLDETKTILGQTELGSGWVREENIAGSQRI